MFIEAGADVNPKLIIDGRRTGFNSLAEHSHLNII